MSDTPPERNSNSKSNLIEVQHVGVTAKLQSPLKSMLLCSSSSTETDNGGQALYCQRNSNSKTCKYNKFSNGEQETTPVEDTSVSNTDINSKILYEMRTMRDGGGGNKNNHKLGTDKVTPSKIEFQLYRKPHKHRVSKTSTSKHRKPSKRTLFETVAPPAVLTKKQKQQQKYQQESFAETSIFKRLRQSLDAMRKAEVKSNKNLFDELTTPTKNQSPPTITSPPPRDTCIGIYPFEHGCAEYLRTTDCHPQILSVVLAERATQISARFWAEFFGTLHIGIAFVVTFILQAYRFVLYSVVNTLCVGFLHMTSDYLIKPILTVLFNGFLQPPLILCFNILTSVRDILEPIADTVNNFVKPIGTVLGKFRLVHATYNNRRSTKTV